MANAGKQTSSSTANGADTNGGGPGAQLKGGPGGHQRTYQACIPCRKRKVKCDLGPVDNPHDPPCARCKRESKTCTFDAERRKKRPGEPDSPGEYENIDELQRPTSASAKRVRYGSASNGYLISPGTPGVQNLPPPFNLEVPPKNHISDSPFEDEDEDDPHAANQSAAVLQTGTVYSQNDALELLYKAAHHRTNSMSSNHPSADATPGSNHANPSPRPNNPAMPGFAYMRSQSMSSVPQKEAALSTWKRARFVRAGWFRAEEGAAYIDYYFKHLHGLTPITIPDYSDPATHKDLLENEPILALTLLTISSRYMKLPGPGGDSRSMYIHQCLTDTLHKKINRIIWGQKQFGGGFCHAGARRSSKVKTLWEDLGTIESLMLLTEWHPRSLHFPPSDDDGELLNPLDEPEMPGFDSESTAGVRLGANDRRVDSWLEPCWRSDRMCWMLLNVAMSLAIESGVFDSDFTPAEFKQNNPELTEEKIRLYFGRKNHLKDLLPVYCAATSGRLELTANLPRNYKYLHELGLTTDYTSRLADRLARLGFDGHVLNTHSSPLKLLETHPQDAVIHFWVEITMILDHGNQTIYSSRKYTRDLIEQGTYTSVLEQYKPMLANWHKAFTACATIPPHMRHVLLIEYEYSRAFLFLLSLHAVVWRCTKNNPMNRINQLAQLAVGQRDGSMEPSAEDISFTPEELRKSIGNDTPLLQEIISACRNIFEIVIHGLRPGDFLKHCPVRTYFRIISAALILLKTFVVGASETDISKSLSLMDTAVKAMRNCIVDDVHVGNRFAMMCESLGRRIRSRMVRIAASGTSGAGASRAETPSRTDTVMAPPNGVGHYPLNGLGGGGKFDTNASSGLSTNWAHQTLAGGSPSLSGRATPNPALWGVSDRTYDLSSASNMTVLPPPTEYYTIPASSDMYGGLDGGENGNAFAGPLPDGDWGTGGGQDWLTLSYESLLNGGEISAGPNGPNIGGEDMLDRLLWSQGGG